MTSDRIRPPAAGSPGTPGELVDRVAAVVRSVPGVADLHAGSFGEVGTYLPGRRVDGIRIGTTAEVHVAVTMGSRLLEVADRVVAALAGVVPVPVHVVVEDVVEPGRTS